MFLKLRPSPLTLVAAALVWLSLCACWWLLPLPLPLPLAVTLLASILAFFSMASLRLPRQLALSPSGAWALREGDGDWRAVELKDALISPFYMVLYFRDRQGDGDRFRPWRRRRFFLPIAIDVVAFDDFCQLRARLRMAKPSP